MTPIAVNDAFDSTDDPIEKFLDGVQYDEDLGHMLVDALGGIYIFSDEELEHFFDYHSYGQDLIDQNRALPSTNGWLDVASLEDEVELSWYTAPEINEMAKTIARDWSADLKKRTDALLGNRGYFADPRLEAYQEGDVAKAKDYLVNTWPMVIDALNDEESDLILSTAVIAGHLEDSLSLSSDRRSPQEVVNAVKEAQFGPYRPFELIDFANAIVQYDRIPFFEWEHGRLQPGEDSIERLGLEEFELDWPDEGNMRRELCAEYFDYARFGALNRVSYWHLSEWEKANKAWSDPWLAALDNIACAALQRQAGDAVELASTPDQLADTAKSFAAKAGVSDSAERQIKH